MNVPSYTTTISPETDQLFMKRCLQLAANGKGSSMPNPMVGAVVVRNGVVIGEGWHQQAGLPHAEPVAIHAVKKEDWLRDSTLYVNLEPCSHYGKTPPCVDLIIDKQIPRVVIGTPDVFPLVSGRGIEKLLAAGIDVTVGVEVEACRELNRHFFTFHGLKRPYIVLKWAKTADGFLDYIRGPENCNKQLMISTPFTRLLTHKMRSECDVILVGTRTAVLDNPNLTVRDWHGRHPVRAVIDRRLSLSPGLNLFDGTVQTLVFTEEMAEDRPGVTFIKLDFGEKMVSQLLSVLYDRNLQTLLVEGGSILHNSFLETGLWDEIQIETTNRCIQAGVKAPDITAISKQDQSFRTFFEKDGIQSIQTFRSTTSMDYNILA